MKIFYDCEFIEDGRTIDLISIGMVREDGLEYYAVNRQMPVRRIRKHEWLMANVVPSLPRAAGDFRNHMPRRWLFNYHHPHVKQHATIAHQVKTFIQNTPDPELWAWYGAYDHVALAQLWGPMINLPEGVPMYTNDLKQEVMRLGNPRLPEQSAGHHNALEDARQVKRWWELLCAREAGEDV